MKSITLKSMSALALALVAGGVMTTTVAAKDMTNDKSQGKIIYQEGKIDIVDPENPDPSNPDNDSKYPAVPTFDFGTQEIVTTEKTYNAEKAGSLIVTDLRGTGDGWKVTVTQAEQLKTADSDELAGAVLTFNDATATNANGETVEKFTSAVELTPGATSPVIFKATQGNGTGVSKLTFADNSDNATLFVPEKTGAKVKANKQYTAQLVWTLTDSPA